MAEQLEKEIGNLKSFEKQAEFFNDERIKWALKEFHQMIKKTEDDFNGAYIQ